MAETRKPASMEELLRRILMHDDVVSLRIETIQMDLETEMFVVTESKGELHFEDCMMDGAVRQAADALGISNWEEP